MSAAPDFDLVHARSLRAPQVWGDYFNRIPTSDYRAYRAAMKDYLLALPRRTGHPGDALASGEVFWISDKNPRWGSKESYDFNKIRLFTFDATGSMTDEATVGGGLLR